MIIADFSRAMANKDWVALSHCFAEQCRLFDYCPLGLGKENYYVYGSKAVDMFYHNKFILGGYSIADPMIQDERTLNFYCCFGGMILHAVATIESFDPKSGLIKEMVIRPA